MRHSLLIMLFGMLLLSSCTSRDGDWNVFSIEEDAGLGARFNEEMEADPVQYPVLEESRYPELYKRVRGIVAKILESDELLHRDDFSWEVRILHQDTVLNAFCTPGGYIYVYTGLIHYLESEDQLAGVLGHEIAHADLRHSTEQMTKSYGLQLALRLIFGDDSNVGDIAGSLAGLTFSRGDETEADLQSVRYLYDTEYDPRGVARFFEKMEQQGESLGPLVFLSTHPNPERRVEKIMEEWKKLGSKKGKRNVEEYTALRNLLPK
jgi:beta-barrel assembly-enhancing protease